MGNCKNFFVLVDNTFWGAGGTAGGGRIMTVLEILMLFPDFYWRANTTSQLIFSQLTGNTSMFVSGFR